MALSKQQQLDIGFMGEALVQADLAAAAGEIPVGAVVVVDGQIIARGHNQSISLNDPSAHAEVMALRAAAAVQQNYRLQNATLYVTLEPCLMCCGALQHARVERLVYGAREPRTGAVVSAFETMMSGSAMWRVAIAEGVLGEACGERLRVFFAQRRD